MRKLKSKQVYYHSLMENSVSTSRLLSPSHSLPPPQANSTLPFVNIMRFGCPSDIIVHIPADVARLKTAAQRNLSKTQCSMKDLLDEVQPVPKRLELKDKEKLIRELNSITIPMESFEEVTPARRMFSIGTEEEEPGEQLRGNIKRRIQDQRLLSKAPPSHSPLFPSVPPLDIEQSEATLLPYRLNSVRPYRYKDSISFFAAIKEQNYKVVRHLVGECRQLVTEQDSLGLTGLHWAVKREDLKMLDWLVRWGAGVNQTDMLNRTPLYLAMKQGSLKLVTRLVDLGADPTIATVSGVSPQQIPKEGTHLWMVIFKREYVST